MSRLDRRDFLKSAGAGLTAAGVMLTPREQALAQAEAEKNRLLRIAACSWPIRSIFKNRGGAGGGRGGGEGREPEPALVLPGRPRRRPRDRERAAGRTSQPRHRRARQPTGAGRSSR